RLGRKRDERRAAKLRKEPAETGQGLDRLREAVAKAHATWNTRVPTAKLNQWLARQVEAHPPPAPGGRRIRLRYMTQVKARPPAFVVFASIPEAVPEAYRRFLVGGLRRDFGLEGTPIRLTFRRTENPYAGKARKR
ncbi:MAG: ribosome biogenesis GTPase Der, partial [Pseudomonadota bacterium]